MADKTPDLSEVIGKSRAPTAAQVTKIHENADKDGSPKAIHHTLGPGPNQAAAGNHTHDGGQSAKLDQIMADITVTGSRGGNAALASLLSLLASNFGLKDTTTP
jgi:hypothetical protein